MKINNTTELLESEFFRTSDLSLATTLSLYFPIENVEYENRSRVCFLFANTPKLQTVIESYWKRDMRIEPQTFFSQLKAIKTRIYSAI